jgi:rhamnogalacturonan endolyase
MENLDRSVVAVRASSTEVLVSWRSLGLDPDGLGFNVYRSTDGGEYTRLNGDVLLEGTNFVDTTADTSKDNSYRVRPVLGGQEEQPSRAFTLPAGNAVEPAVRIPLEAGGPIKFLWVGDLDGDGAYDYVIDRQTAPQQLQAYKSDGTLLWEMSMGPNSLDQDNIEGGTAHNPAYRNGMTLKGYVQSSNVDYFLGHDMVTPPQPNISYAGPGPRK